MQVKLVISQGCRLRFGLGLMEWTGKRNMKKGMSCVCVNNPLSYVVILSKHFAFRIQLHCIPDLFCLTTCYHPSTHLRWLYLYISINKQVILALLFPTYFYHNQRARSEQGLKSRCPLGWCSSQTRTGLGLLGKPPAVKQFPPSEANRCTRPTRKCRYEANKCGWTQPLFRGAPDHGIN